MANLTGGVIAQGNTSWNLTQASERITLDILEHPYLKLFRKYGVINDESMQAAKKKKGDLVKMPNTFRHNSNGADVSTSIYPQAGTLEHGQREIRLGELKDILQYDRPETMSMQRDTFGVLGKNEEKMLRQWGVDLFTVGSFMQLCGNTATSVSVPLLSSTAFSGTKLNNCKLLSAGIAPTTQYFAYGSDTANANPSAITATNSLLTMQDFQRAKLAITRTFAGINRWNRLQSSDAMALVFISETGHFQLINQARAANADSTLSQFRYSLIEGGKKWEGLNMFHVPDLNMLFFVVPDDLMPRAVHSGTENALSRCALIVGAGALDFAIGAAYPGTNAPSFKISVDDQTFKLDDKIYIGLRGIFAGKKVQLPGFGSNSGNTYDHATYVIAHSAAS